MKKRLFLYTTLIIFAGLFSFFFASLLITHNNNLKIAKDTVIETTRICADLYNRVDDVNAFVQAGSDVRITVISADGNVLADNSPIDIDTAENHLSRPEIQAALNGSGEFSRSPETFVRYSETIGANFIYYAVKIDSDGGEVFIRTAVPVAKIDTYLLQSLPLLIMLLVCVALLCFSLTRGTAIRILKPFSSVEERLKLLAIGEYTHNPDVSGYEEINKITQGIDEVALLLQNSMKHREEFFANASHELKTPLTAIKGFNELTAINNKDEKLGKYIAGITRETDRMLSLIGDMLNLSELENTKSVNPVTVSLATAVNEAAETLSTAIAEKNLTFELFGVKTATVEAEQGHIYELMKNLIENAVRYNKKGGRVSVTVNDARIVVSDTGIGISAEEQARIFERFYRVEKSRSQLNGGTGLGLSIVKHICGLYGWKLSLRSGIGEGTEVMVEFIDTAGFRDN